MREKCRSNKKNEPKKERYSTCNSTILNKKGIETKAGTRIATVIGNIQWAQNIDIGPVDIQPMNSIFEGVSRYSCKIVNQSYQK